jgi:hypothetical protein
MADHDHAHDHVNVHVDVYVDVIGFSLTPGAGEALLRPGVWPFPKRGSKLPQNKAQAS